MLQWIAWLISGLLFISVTKTFASDLSNTESLVRVRVKINKLNRPMDAVEVVPFEDYVMAVLTAEMPLSWPLETLKAQAIAIRSYTRAKISEQEDREFDVESTVLDQVYKKPDRTMNPSYLVKAQRAVKETEGVLLLNQKGLPLKAYYHADCGGRTVLPSSVWGQDSDDDVGTAVDPFCSENPRSRWSLSISKERLKNLLKSFVGDIRSNDFRKLVGFMELKSTQFDVYDNKGQIQFIGKGFGHGAGLCQWGSRFLGQKGFSYQRILKHYYPLAVLKGDVY